MKRFEVEVHNVFEDGMPPLEEGCSTVSIDVVFMNDDSFEYGYADFSEGNWEGTNGSFEYEDYPFWFIPPYVPTQEKNDCTTD